MKQAAAKSAPQTARAPARPAPTPAPEAMGAADLSTLQSSLTGGAPLPLSTRQRLEAGFGTNLGDVRVHTGGAAAKATSQVQAEAFATGPNIAFAPGRYNPGTKAGDHLIAEEVAHVVQQRGSGGQVVQRHALVSNISDSAEVSARAAADNIVAGRKASLSLSGLSTRGRIMRRAKASTIAPSPVVAAPTSVLGATRAGPAPILTPTMTSTLSPAGGKLVDSASRRDTKQASNARSEQSAKAPDEAQTTQAGTAPGAPNVMTAGSPVGAAAEGPAAAAKPKREGKKEKEQKTDTEKEKKEKSRKGASRAPRGGGGGGGGTFGKVTGDRGAETARQAQRRLEDRAVALSTNEGADSRIGAAREAAAPPANAAQASGQQGHATALEGADVPAGDPAAARAASRSAVSAATPGTIEELEDFAGAGGAARRAPLTDAIADQAQSQTAQVQSSLDAVNAPPEGAAPALAVPQPEPMTAPDTADPALTQAVPPQVNEEALDATEFKAEADAKLAEHDVDDETLNKADEGPLRDIGNDKTKLNDDVEAAGSRARATETQARDTARSALSGAQSGAQADMVGQREAGQTGVSTQQDSTRVGEEQGEQSLADQINTTYQTAQTEVNTKLSSLTTDAVESFRERQGARLEAFASGVRSDLEALKRRRYSGLRGAARRVRDWLLSINSVSEVKRLYERHRNQYIADIDALITQIKAYIDTTIEDCKTALRTARETIEQLMTDNADQLDTAAQEALTRARDGFTRMEQRIDQAAEAAKRALDAERERAIQAMDAELEKIRSENAGLVDRIAGAIAALAAALGQFMALMARITRMGIGTFLSSALAQAGDGMRNHLWGQLQEAFKQWLFMKLPMLQLLLSLPPNWYEMLTALATNMIGLFTENLPAMLPAIGTAAMIWLATTLAAKLIPGVGAIMAVIDAIRGAYALVQSLFTAAQAFYSFLMAVAGGLGGAAVAFARAIAFGIVAAVDAILTFLGVDRLIRRVVGAIARPFGRIIRRIGSRFRALMQRMRRRRRRGRRQRQRDGGRGGNANRRGAARSRARTRRRQRRQRRSRRSRRRDRRNPNTRRRESAADRRRRRQQERERRRRERLQRAVRAIRPKVARLHRRGVSRLGLRARLAVWRIRYRLSSLAITGGRIMARVNPASEAGRISQMSPQRIGNALEPILREAERIFEQQRLQNPQVASEAAAFDQGLASGRHTVAGPNMNDADVVFGARRFFSGPRQMLMPYRSRRGQASRIASFSTRPGGPLVTIRDNLRGSMMVQPGAPSYAGFTPATLQTPSGNQLLDVVEAARAPGQLATRAVTRDLVSAGMVDPMQAASGEFNPMAPQGASVAADQEFRGRQDSGSFTQARVDQASATRRERTGRVFQRLDRVLHQQARSMDIYGEGTALRDLAQAFRRWAITNVSRAGRRASTPAQRDAAVAGLIASMVAFLRSRYP